MHLARLAAVVMLAMLAACADRRPTPAAMPPSRLIAPSSTTQRPLVETPAPAAPGPAVAEPAPAVPALKPSAQTTLQESEALANQASPKGPPVEGEPTPSQKAMGRMAAQIAAPPPPIADAARLVGLSQADATALFGPPAESKNQPPSQIWSYHSAVCDVKLFFYPEVGGPAFRALTYQIDERGASDATHNACLASLAKPHAG